MGRRLTVSLILGELFRGQTLEEIQRNYEVSNDEIKSCIGYAKKCVDSFDEDKNKEIDIK